VIKSLKKGLAWSLALQACLIAFPVYANDPCRSGYESVARQKLLSGLERREQVRNVEFQFEEPSAASSGRHIVIARSPDAPFDAEEWRDELGFISFTVSKDGQTLHIFKAATRINYQRLGVNEVLFETTLNRFRNIREICTKSLIGVNEFEIRKAMRRGASLEEAIRSSPAYRTRARLGFTEIVTDSISPKNFRFCVRKP
jgi:hypothetical protein